MTSISYGHCIPSSSHTEWTDRKRPATEEIIDVPSPKKRMYHLILESESDLPTDESSESVYSVQDKETDFAKDASDSSYSESRLDDFVEFEVVSEIEGDANPLGAVGEISSGAEEFLGKNNSYFTLYVEEEIAILADSSDSSSPDSYDIEIPKADYWTCLQCKTKNNNPLYRFCEKCFQLCTICKKKKEFDCFLICLKCFQVRKSFFPDRPKPKKRRRPRRKPSRIVQKGKTNLKRKHSDSLSISENISQNEEINNEKNEKIKEGNSTTKTTEENLSQNEDNEDEISIPKKRKKLDENISSSITTDGGTLSQDSTALSETQIFSQDSAICLSNNEETPPAEIKLSYSETTIENSSTPNSSQLISSRSVPNYSELGMCIMCMNRPKNGIYIHPNGTSHLCCCYECAHRVWLSTKKCPICNGKITNISKVFVY